MSLSPHRFYPASPQETIVSGRVLCLLPLHELSD